LGLSRLEFGDSPLDLDGFRPGADWEPESRLELPDWDERDPWLSEFLSLSFLSWFDWALAVMTASEIIEANARIWVRDLNRFIFLSFRRPGWS
jgi:hypothetical protein